MYWKISSMQEHQKLSRDFCLPKPAKTLLIGFVLKEKAKNFALSLTPQMDSFPVAGFSWDELSVASTWQKILELHPLSQVEMAHYWRTVLEPRGLEADILLKSYALRDHFHNRAQWKELGELGEKSRLLAAKYGFPLRILRLWERLNDKEQDQWLSLWGSYPFGRNLIQDIISDYYELKEPERKEALGKALALSQDWEKVPKKQADALIRGARDIRDSVRELRFPQISQAWRVLYQKKRRLEQYLDKNIRLALPRDLEAHSLELKLNFTDLDELKRHISALNEPEAHKIFQEILDML